jgi:hypothetical protein
VLQILVVSEQPPYPPIRFSSNVQIVSLDYSPFRDDRSSNTSEKWKIIFLVLDPLGDTSYRGMIFFSFLAGNHIQTEIVVVLPDNTKLIDEHAANRFQSLLNSYEATRASEVGELILVARIKSPDNGDTCENVTFDARMWTASHITIERPSTESQV